MRTRRRPKSRHVAVHGLRDWAEGTVGSIGFALGEESFTHTDFVLPGIVPVEWARTYRSNFGAHDGQGPLVPRWTTPYHVAFEAKGDELLYHDASGCCSATT